jgi:uncharacterized protein (TIGR00255 family)
MTGFGASLQEGAGVRVEVELKTVNSRYLDLSIRLPRVYTAFEIPLRDVLSEYFSRGRVDLTVNRTPISAEAFSGGVNRVVFDQLWNEQIGICQELNLDSPEVRGQLMVSLFSRREVIDPEETGIDRDKEWPILEGAVREAALRALEGRKFEGEKLKVDLLERLILLEEYRDRIEEGHNKQPQVYRDKVLQKAQRLIGELGVTVDEARIAAEVAMYADKIDVAEELVRLKSHFGQFRNIAEKQASGRKLGFLLQELLREFNTIASKVQSADIQQLVVDARSEVERMREQSQNLE